MMLVLNLLVFFFLVNNLIFWNFFKPLVKCNESTSENVE